MKRMTSLVLVLLAWALLGVTNLEAVELSVVTGVLEKEELVLRDQLDQFEAQTGHTVKIVAMPSSSTDQFGQYKLWLSAKNRDIDLYKIDVIWAPQLHKHFVDLTEYAKDVIPDHFPSIIESQTIDGRLMALPMFTDAPALYYRKDLLKKYGVDPPKTWEDMTDMATMILAKEKGRSKGLQGFVWQGMAYEGLTCNALEWVMSHGGGQIVEPDGSISINNPKAVAALELAKSWVGQISPAGVLSYQEEESRAVWQKGNAIFMRNWPYAHGLSDTQDSGVKGKFDVIPLPVGKGGSRSAATLGGWNIAVSKYSTHRKAAVELAKFMTSKEMQKDNALRMSRLPTIKSLYSDATIARTSPIIPKWRDVFENAVPRPSAPTKRGYNEVSKEFFTAVHNTLSGQGSAKKNLAKLEKRLKRLKRRAWK